MLNSVFSIHAPGSGSDPLSCGPLVLGLHDQGIQAMQAFIYAINRVNTDIAPGSVGCIP